MMQYSIYVLESSTSRRLTYFMPPLNLIPLLLLRPLRAILPSEDVRRVRIIVLKATHAPFVALIWAYERVRRLISRHAPPTLTRTSHTSSRPLTASQMSLDPGYNSSKISVERPALNKVSQRSTGQSASAPPESALLGSDTMELVALVQSLAAKVDGLTAMVAGQQRD
jgi:hypothetical protein